VDRLERLLNLVAALIDARRLLTARDIQERVAGYPAGEIAFNRAFARDKATLREMGIPLFTEALDPGDPEAGQGYRIPRDRYELPDLGLEPEEVAALYVASTAVRLDGGAQATEAIWKLGGVQAPASVPAAASASLPGSEHLAVLFTATTERRPLTFDYRGETRRVEPWRLNFRNGFWYLTGRDMDRDERRTFRLDRITTAPTVGEPATFVRPETLGTPGTTGSPSTGAPHRTGGATPPWEMGDEEPVEVDILVDADQARYAVSTAGEPALAERRSSGEVVLRLRVTNRAALRSFVLGLLDHAEILSPTAERVALVAWVRAAAGVR
jgi:proteasome accessory factor B